MKLRSAARTLQHGRAPGAGLAASLLVLSALLQLANGALVDKGSILARPECGGGDGSTPVTPDLFCTFAGEPIEYNSVAQYTLTVPSGSGFSSNPFDLVVQLRPDDNSDVNL